MRQGLRGEWNFDQQRNECRAPQAVGSKEHRWTGVDGPSVSQDGQGLIVLERRVLAFPEPSRHAASIVTPLCVGSA